MDKNYKQYLIIVGILLAIKLSLYYAHSISYNNPDRFIEEHDVTVEYGEIDEYSIEVTFAAMNEENVNNIILIYKQDNIDIKNGTIVEENISVGDVVTINEIDCNKSIYIVDKRNDNMNILEEYSIPC